MNINQNIEESINHIIKLRQPFGEQVKSFVDSNINDLRSSISELEDRRLKLISLIDDSETKTELGKLDFSNFIDQLEEESEKLSKISKRFLRGNINIGVVGITGHGKSTFLQSLSGLPNELLPAREGEPCTASKSIVTHYEEGEPYAKVIFYSEESFLENVIYLHYQQLSSFYTNKTTDLDLGRTPNSLDDFAQRELPQISDEYDTTKRVIYTNLISYKRYLNQYRKNLKLEPLEITITSGDLLNELPKYVAKPDTSKNRTPSFDYLAVKEVKIFSKFQNDKVGKIAMVDIPGSQENRVGNEERIVETLGQDVDVILFFYKPETGTYGWDNYTPITNLYSLVNKSINNFSERSLIVLNKNENSGNYRACEELKQSQSQSTIKVSGCEIADCSKAEDVDKIIELTLQKLSHNDHIVELDKNYAASCQENLVTIHKNLIKELKQANTALASYANQERKFGDWFDEFIVDITNRLNELKDQLSKECNTEDPNLKKVFEEVFKDCEDYSLIPSEQEIANKSIDPEFKGSLEAVYYVSIPLLRAHLSQKFHKLDKGLKDSITDLKCLVTDVLVQRVTKANLGDLTEAEFLEIMTSLLDERQNKLGLGFQTLSSFDLSYSGLILPEIREYLDVALSSQTNIVDSQTSSVKKTETYTESLEEKPTKFQIREDIPNYPSSQTFNIASLEFSSAKVVKTQLEQRYQNAIKECKIILTQWLTYPSKIRYLMIREFIDFIFNSQGMKKEWELFLNDDDICRKVWSERQEFENRKQIQKEWEKLVQKAMENNSFERLKFIKSIDKEQST
jgi:energy-coupling factor transporter ATP-binding protein EcfA2